MIYNWKAKDYLNEIRGYNVQNIKCYFNWPKYLAFAYSIDVVLILTNHVAKMHPISLIGWGLSTPPIFAHIDEANIRISKYRVISLYPYIHIMSINMIHYSYWGETWWRPQMETFPSLLALSEGSVPSTMGGSIPLTKEYLCENVSKGRLLPDT